MPREDIKVIQNIQMERQTDKPKGNSGTPILNFVETGDNKQLAANYNKE